jgi:nucleotide-binding universal stress UspA family protein
MLPLRTILHPTDFSEHASFAFRLACSVARDHGARLIVLHVLQPPLATLGGYPAVPPLPEGLGEQDVERQLRAMKPPRPGVSVEHRLLVGTPVALILDVARSVPCDLIVMGTHGRKGLGRLLMGSVAEEVVRNAPCPVLTVKNPVALLESANSNVSEPAAAR